MALVFQANIMRITLERSAFRQNIHLAESLPVLQRIVVLEGTIGYFLGIQAAVGRKIDVLQENAVHCGLDGNADGIGIHHKAAAPWLGHGNDARKERRCS